MHHISCEIISCCAIWIIIQWTVLCDDVGTCWDGNVVIYIDEIFSHGLQGNCRHDNFRYSQWRIFREITTVSLIAFCEVNAGVLLMFIIETISRASIDHSGKLHTSPLTRSLRYEIWQQSPVHDNAVVSGWRPVLNRVNSLTPERRGNCASILFILI